MAETKNIFDGIRNPKVEFLIFIGFSAIVALAIIILSLNLSYITPQAKQLIPPSCDYDLNWFYTTSEDSHQATAIRQINNQSIIEVLNDNAKPTKSVYVKKSQEIWTLDYVNSMIYVTQTISLNEVYKINLGTAQCFQPSDISYNGYSLVFVTCSNSSQTAVISIDQYSIVNIIPVPSELVSTHYAYLTTSYKNMVLVVYSPDRYYLYSLNNNLDISVVKLGVLSGINGIANGYGSKNKLYNIYFSTTTKNIFKLEWSNSLTLIEQTASPLPLPIIDMEVSNDNAYLYVLMAGSNIISIYDTNTMKIIMGSSSNSGVIPNITSIALSDNGKTMLLTGSPYPSLVLTINQKTQLFVEGSQTFIETGTNSNHAIAYLQECTCQYC